jgi:hypothetical protein
MVTIRDGSATLGSVRLDTTGAASLAGVVLSPGSHQLTAAWGGDSNVFATTSPPVTVTLPLPVKGASTTVLATGAPSSVYGEAVTFTATVNGSGATPTGTVTFMDGTKRLGTATLSGGSASLAYTALAVGGHSVTATYGGDAGFSTSASAAVTETVGKAATTTALTASPAPTPTGRTVILVAVVGIVPPGGGVPTGSVTFRDGSLTPGTARLNASGMAIFQTTPLGTGMHSLTANWGGDSNLTRSSSSAEDVTISESSPTGNSPAVDDLAAIQESDLLAMLVSLSESRKHL